MISPANELKVVLVLLGVAAVVALKSLNDVATQHRRRIIGGHKTRANSDVNCNWSRELHGLYYNGPLFKSIASTATLKICAEQCSKYPGECKSLNWEGQSHQCHLMGSRAPHSYRSLSNSDPYWRTFIYYAHATYVDGLSCTSTAISGETTPENNPGNSNQNNVCGLQAPGYEPYPDKPKNPRHRIVNGREARPHSWPWQVALFKSTGFFGGGVLFSPDIIITAAHAIMETEFPYEYLYAMVGVHNRVKARTGAENGTEFIRIDRAVVFENFNNETNEGDIAVAKLDKPVTLGPTKRTICLPVAEKQVPDNTRCVVSGLGATKFVEDEQEQMKYLPQVLQEVWLPIINNDVCNASDAYDGNVTTNQFCAGYMSGEADACQGDSGGPLVCKVGNVWTLYGINSWGKDCATKNKPGVYTTVVNYLDWIHKAIEKLNKPAPKQQHEELA